MSHCVDSKYRGYQEKVGTPSHTKQILTACLPLYWVGGFGCVCVFCALPWLYPFVSLSSDTLFLSIFPSPSFPQCTLPCLSPQTVSCSLLQRSSSFGFLPPLLLQLCFCLQTLLTQTDRCSQWPHVTVLCTVISRMRERARERKREKEREPQTVVQITVFLS